MRSLNIRLAFRALVYIYIYIYVKLVPLRYATRKEIQCILYVAKVFHNMPIVQLILTLELSIPTAEIRA